MNPSKKMGIEEQDYDDDVCHANELHNLYLRRFADVYVFCEGDWLACT